MAAGVLQAPGSKYGPCAKSCRHRDCGLTRAMSLVACSRCGEPIGFDVRFYDVDASSTLAKPHPGRELAHARCEEDAADTTSKGIGAQEEF